jgi:hypothetical protein
VDVAVCDVPHHFLATLGTLSLGEREVDDRCLTAQLDIPHGEERRACLCAAEELQVEGYRMGLVLLREGAFEVGFCNLQKDGRDEAAMGN